MKPQYRTRKTEKRTSLTRSLPRLVLSVSSSLLSFRQPCNPTSVLSVPFLNEIDLKLSSHKLPLHRSSPNPSRNSLRYCSTNSQTPPCPLVSLHLSHLFSLKSRKHLKLNNWESRVCEMVSSKLVGRALRVVNRAENEKRR